MVSVIVPTLNEERAIGGTLAAVARQDGDFEVVVSDGGSTDGTPEIVAQHASVRWVEGPPGRARQLDRGVARSRGEVLLFLHADTVLPPGALRLVDRLARDDRPLAGGFPHRYARGGPLIQLASRVHSLRSRISGIYYGDQAPFVSRDLYAALGGFGDLPVMEDVDFARRLRRRVRPLRMPLPVTNCPRKLEARGVLRCGAESLLCLIAFRLRRHQWLARQRYFDPVR